MKFLAILKDSVREAIDAKVFYVMLVLSALAILGVASISFRPEPAEEGLQKIVSRFPLGAPLPGHPEPLIRYEVKEFQQVNDTPRPWEGDYRFDLLVQDSKEIPLAFRAVVFRWNLKDPEAQQKLMGLVLEAKAKPPEQQKQFFEQKLGEAFTKVTPRQMEAFIEAQLTAYGTLQTTSIRMKEDRAGEVRFAVAARAKEGARNTWPHTTSVAFGAVPLGTGAIGPALHSVEDKIVGAIGAGVAMLIATVITAFFIPNMLRKGSVDLLLSKPIHRTTLLVYKYVGGLSFMFLNTVFVVVGIWLVLGLRSGVWAPGFLLVIFILTFEFAIFYAFSTLFSVLTRSPIVSILVACLAWLVLFLVGWSYLFVDLTREATPPPFPKWVYLTVDSAHAVLPRYKDLDALTSRLLAHDLLPPESAERKGIDFLYGKISWAESLGVSTAFIALMLGLAGWRFATKDY